ncbi:MAG: hypothetical protein FIA99_06920 [Ruminiclostridium sp.]|nr:hypothetical protein [Ruminiclostridium sp.]
MITKFDEAGSYNVKKGEIVFLEGHETQTLNILLQGEVDVYISSQDSSNKKDKDVLSKSYKIFGINKNIFIGANDIILNSKHSFSFLAARDCSIYLYPAQTAGQAWAFINSRKDYGTYLVNSLNTMIDSSSKTLKEVLKTAASLKLLTENLVTWFWALKEFYLFDYIPALDFFKNGMDRLQQLREKGLQSSPVFNRQFIEEDHDRHQADENRSMLPIIQLKTEYFQHLCNMPAELQKSFFAADIFITSYHCREESECLEGIITSLKETFSAVEHYYKRLYSDNSECIYSVFLKAAGEMTLSGLDNAPALQALEYITSVIKEIVSLYGQKYCHKCETDLEYTEHSLKNVQTAIHTTGGNGAASPSSVKAEADFSSLPDELTDCAGRILEYSELPREKTDFFMMNLLAFRNMRDRLSTDEDARNIRSGAASVFFEIYEAVFKKACIKADDTRLISMFLNYGFMDEKVLTPEQTLSLYKIAGMTGSTSQDPIYNMREWLSKIYAMEKDPSINEFGQDYFDVFRDMKKRGQATDKDKNAYNSDKDARLSYEAQNMLKTNHKLCHGQISVYFPVLHKEMIIRDLAKTRITPEKIKESMEKILEVDFSAFYREIHHLDTNKAIEKEIIMKSITPEILLMPVYGSRAVMWQEITGKNRNTPGRFILPSFTEEDLDTILLRLVGNFRWELCRTMMGSAWNDVTQSSLTSEYTDYIQFYKKNKELSDEAKDKIKAQSIKYHGRMRDIFTSDYEIWVNNESKGNARLNKVARSMLYKHCPFSRGIREQLEKQPMYNDMAAQFRNQRAKTARDLENRYGKYVKNNIRLDPEMEHNLVFYRDL